MGCKVKVIKENTWNKSSEKEFTIKVGDIMEVEKQVTYNMNRDNNVTYYYGNYIVPHYLVEEIDLCGVDKRRFGFNYRRIFSLIIFIAIVAGLYYVTNKAALSAKKKK